MYIADLETHVEHLELIPNHSHFVTRDREYLSVCFEIPYKSENTNTKIRQMLFRQINQEKKLKLGKWTV